MSEPEHDDLLLNSTGADALPMDGLLAELLGNWDDLPEAEAAALEAREEQPSEHTPLSALMGRLLDVEEPPAEEPPAEIVEDPAPVLEAVVELTPPLVTEEPEPAAALPEPQPEPAPEPEPPMLVLQPEPQPEALSPLPEPELEPESEPADDGALRGLLSVMRRELAQSEPVRHRDQPVVEAHTRERFLAFELAGESYAVALTRVMETDRLPRVTRVPGLPDYVRGVCNLRGAVLPVVDLRSLLQLEESSPARDERILVVKPSPSDLPVALVVDSLLGVSLLAREELHRTPQWLEGKITPFLDGIGTHKGKLVSVLDLDRVFTAAELREAPAA